MNRRVQIRRAVLDDLNWLMVQLREFSKFFGTKLSLYGDGTDLEHLMKGIIEQHVIFIADDEDFGPVGFIAGYLAPHPFNSKIKVLSEAFWWVEAKHRGLSPAGAMLLNAFVDMGEQEADFVIFTLEVKSPVREQTLARRGFKLHERSYLLEVG